MASIYYTLFSGSTHSRWQNPDFLSASELARLPDGRFEKRRRDWLLGRWTAKHLLRAVDPECAALPLTAISIENEPGGAPYLQITGQPEAHPACISVSHSDNTALCALSFDLTVGADLEKIEPRSTIFIEDYLTAAEARTARSLHGAEQHAWVTLAWSAKEAAFKALRTGLRADTRSVEITRVNPPGADGWGALELRSMLPGANKLHGWQQQTQGFVLTLAALAASEITEIRQITLV